MSQHKGYTPPVTGEVSGVSAKRAGLMCGLLDVSGAMVPAIICNVRMTAKGVRGFVRVCSGRSIAVRPAGSGTDAKIPERVDVETGCQFFGSEAFECIGNVDDLEYLAGHPSVTGWQYLDKTANAVDCRASGATKAK